MSDVDESQWRRDLEEELRDPGFRRVYKKTLRRLARRQRWQDRWQRWTTR